VGPNGKGFATGKKRPQRLKKNGAFPLAFSFHVFRKNNVGELLEKGKKEASKV